MLFLINLCSRVFSSSFSHDQLLYQVFHLKFLEIHEINLFAFIPMISNQFTGFKVDSVKKGSKTVNSESDTRCCGMDLEGGTHQRIY